jgi:hypothetical protein
MKKVFGLAALALVLLPHVLSAQTTPVGDWKAVFVGPIATRPQMVSHIMFTIRLTSSGFTGTAHTEPEWPGDLDVSDLKFEGNHLTFRGTGRIGSSSTIGGVRTDHGYPKLLFDGTIKGDDMKLDLTWVTTELPETVSRAPLLMQATRVSKEPSVARSADVRGPCVYGSFR